MWPSTQRSNVDEIEGREEQERFPSGVSLDDADGKTRLRETNQSTNDKLKETLKYKTLKYTMYRNASEISVPDICTRDIVRPYKDSLATKRIFFSRFNEILE